jgi:phosphoribosylamine--glycine ligase
LVIGSGGREHALAWKLAAPPKVGTVFVAPGNAGTSLEPKLKNVPITDIKELIKFALENDICFTLVGPEAPLALGIVDEFRRHNLKIWGPTQYCAQLESSKSFAKDFMIKHNIPTAKYQTFSDGKLAREYLANQTLPIVIKADGLAAGKGVLVAQTMDSALSFIDDIFANNKFGNAGSKAVIEECLIGTEASFIVMIDGKNILPMASSQDHKRLLNNDEGPNTGGMGAFSPSPIVDKKLHDRVIKEIIQPVIDGMKNAGHEYSGFLYAGLMVDSKGNPKTLEFNCRFGDPETQPIMLRLESDLVDLIEAGLEQKLDTIDAVWSNKFAIGVVLASSGYPDSPQKDDIISGLGNIASDIKVFHSGTSIKENKIYTAGGRVLCVVGMDDSIALTQQKVYQSINEIKYNGMQYRTDIGSSAIK